MFDVDSDTGLRASHVTTLDVYRRRVGADATRRRSAKTVSNRPPAAESCSSTPCEAVRLSRWTTLRRPNLADWFVREQRTKSAFGLLPFSR
jgi:hypothetical protein